MTSLESQNKGLIQELRKLAKVSANEIKAARVDDSSQRLEILEKNLRLMKQSIKKLGS